MVLWKPTASQCAAIKAAAAKEAGVPVGAILLEPGWRGSLDDGNVMPSINIALVSDRPEWGDTDLADYGRWSEFRAGVPLTDYGRAIVDFYIRKRGDPHYELLGNITVEYQGGAITRIHGYGPNSEYPTQGGAT